jgi:hypothetical protein
MRCYRFQRTQRATKHARQRAALIALNLVLAIVFLVMVMASALRGHGLS